MRDDNDVVLMSRTLKENIIPIFLVILSINLPNLIDLKFDWIKFRPFLDIFKFATCLK